MELVYFGTPEIAATPLRALHAAGHEIVLVVSGADKRRGRGRTTSPSPVKAAALELGLDVVDDPSAAADVGADLGVVVAYGRIIRPPLLAVLPMVNLHFSLLPRWRGAAPVERAILAGDDETGVCVMAVEEGLDTGAVYASRRLGIGPFETADELRGRLVHTGTELLVDTLSAELPTPVAQPDDGVTYAAKLSPAELEIDWSRTCEEILRVVRVGGAWTTWRGGRFKIHAASLASERSGGAEPGTFVGPLTVACGTGEIDLTVVQAEGKARTEAAAWAHGARPTGDRLGA